MYAIAAAVASAIGVLLISDAPLDVRQAVSGVGIVGGGILVALSCLDRLRRSAGRRRRAWVLFALCGLLASASNLQLYLSSAFGAGSVTLGSAFLTLALVAGVSGVVVYPNAARRRTDLTRIVLDGVVVGGSALFIAALLIFPQVFAATGGMAAGILAVMPPVVDVAMATVAALLFLRTRSNDRRFLGPLSLGFICYAVSDFAFAVVEARGTYSLGSIADFGWIAGYLLVAIGLRQASVSPQPEAAEEASPVVGTVITFSLFLVAALISLLALQGERMPLGAGILWLLVLLAVAGRQIFLIVDNESLRRILEDRVIQRSHELRQVTQQSDLLITSVGDGIYGVDRDGVITFANPAAAEILRYTSEQLIGSNAHDLFHAVREDGTPFPAEACYITEAIRHRVVTSAEEDMYTRPDGHLVPVEVTATPLTEDDQVRGAVVVFRDVTQRREMDRLKSEFVSMVSHELRTPLTAIRGSLGLLSGGALGALDQRAGRMVKIALDSSERLSRLINDILDVERIEAGVMPMNRADLLVGDVVEAAVSQVSVIGEDAGVSVRVLATPGTVHADPDWVQQTLLNLLGNAIKFSPPGAVVDVLSSVRGEFVEFAIRDQGRGIPEDKLDVIFSRFEQVDSSDRRDKGGTGLGLAISRSLVERLGGRIWAENNSDGGATFRFTLPRSSTQPSDAAPPLRPRHGASPNEPLDPPNPPGTAAGAGSSRPPHRAGGDGPQHVAADLRGVSHSR